MMYVCTVCESEEVVHDAWVSLNTGEIAAEFDNLWCMTCEGECSVKEA